MATEHREQELADAALRIVARDGLAALSFRAVASESGWSLGAVQKAFTSKRELIAATLRRAEQSTETAAGPPAQPDLRTWLTRLVLGALPLDAERRAAVVVGTAFADQAAFDDDIAAAIRVRNDGIRSQLERLCAWRRTEGELHARLSDAQIVRALLAFAGGLAAELLYTPADPAAITDLVENTVTALLAD